MGPSEEHRIAHFSNRSVWILDSPERWSILQFPSRENYSIHSVEQGAHHRRHPLCDIDCYGSDLAWPMVTGTRENAAWAQEIGGSGAFEIRNGSAHWILRIVGKVI